jgi:hypothetical protein
MRQTLNAYRLPPDMTAALEIEAACSGVSRSQVVRTAMAEWLAARGHNVRSTPYREQRIAA